MAASLTEPHEPNSNDAVVSTKFVLHSALVSSELIQLQFASVAEHAKMVEWVSLSNYRRQWAVRYSWASLVT
jgi:hypothetical protein